MSVEGLNLGGYPGQFCAGRTAIKGTSRPEHNSAEKKILPKLIRSICRFLPANGSSLVSLDEKTLLNKAHKQTGLDDPGDESFHEALEVLLKSLESDAI